MHHIDAVKISGFLDVLGLTEQPFAVLYTDSPPKDGISPKAGTLPSIETEAAGRVDWQSLNANFSCVIGLLWRARKKGTSAFFDREHFGCLGGAFYLGFLKPQLNRIAYYVSSGIPGQREGEHYLESPEVTKRFFNEIDPRPAPARYCVFKPLNLLTPEDNPELIVIFARAEVISGLNQLASFVTNDFDVVRSPFGAGCSGIVTWPFTYMARGDFKAVVGGWDPSDRVYMKPDELTFSMPTQMFRKMVDRWQESFLTTRTWAQVRKRIERSKKAWGEA
jgi:uncharacterized protein (DUF169 family)